MSDIDMEEKKNVDEVVEEKKDKEKVVEELGTISSEENKKEDEGEKKVEEGYLKEGDGCVLFGSRTEVVFVILEKDKVYRCRFGVFNHNDIIGKKKYGDYVII